MWSLRQRDDGDKPRSASEQTITQVISYPESMCVMNKRSFLPDVATHWALMTKASIKPDPRYLLLFQDAVAHHHDVSWELKVVGLRGGSKVVVSSLSRLWCWTLHQIKRLTLCHDLTSTSFLLYLPSVTSRSWQSHKSLLMTIQYYLGPSAAAAPGRKNCPLVNRT